VTEDLSIVEAYADEAHDSIGQMRKYGGLPYKTHPQAVRVRVARHVPGYLPEAMALLHDVFEDVRSHEKWRDTERYGLIEIARLFGDDVSEGVWHLSNEYTHAAYPHFNSAKRAELEAVRLGKTADHPLGFFIQSVKLADVIENMLTLPWREDLSFAKFFARKSFNLSKVLTRGHRNLQDELGVIFDYLMNHGVFTP
jgi:(p)ppGpp synthase/HD superfamily hydrolase